MGNGNDWCCDAGCEAAVGFWDGGTGCEAAVGFGFVLVRTDKGHESH